MKTVNSVFDNIKVEINKKYDNIEDYDGLDEWSAGIKRGLKDALEIIDKHCQESEE